MSQRVVFVAPYFGTYVNKCIAALHALDDVEVGVVTSLPASHVPGRERLAGHYQVDDPLDPEQLTRAVRAFAQEWGRVDRLIGYLEPLQIPLAIARERVGIDGVHADVARNFRDKHRMKRVLGEAGLPVAQQMLVRSAGDAVTLGERLGFPFVLKPVDGVASKNTFRVTNEAQLFTALNRLMPSPERPVQAERFVTGDEQTMEAVVLDGEVVWQSSTYYLPGPLTVIENDWMQYCLFLPREEGEPHVQRFAPINRAALRALGLVNGFSHMEWFDGGPGAVPVIGEVGARPAGVNIMAMNGCAHDVDIWQKWIELEVHRRFEMPPRRYAAGTVFLRGEGPGREVATVQGLDEVIDDLGDAIVQGKRPAPGMPRSAHYEGEGNLVVRHESTRGCLDLMREILHRTRITYA